MLMEERVEAVSFSRRQRVAGVYAGPAAWPDNVNPLVSSRTDDFASC